MSVVVNTVCFASCLPPPLPAGRRRRLLQCKSSKAISFVPVCHRLTHERMHTRPSASTVSADTGAAFDQPALVDLLDVAAVVAGDDEPVA